MTPSRYLITTWQYSIFLLGRTLLAQKASATSDCSPGEASGPKLSLYPVERCSPALLSDRSVISEPVVGVDSISCVRKGLQNPSCDIVVSQTYSKDFFTCTLMSAKGHVQGLRLNVEHPVLCEAILTHPCQNDGRLADGICVCPEEFTGEYCERKNPKFCNCKWKKIQSYSEVDSVTTEHDSLLLASVLYLNPKLRVREDAQSLWRTTEVSKVKNNVDDVYFSLLQLPKKSIDSFSTNAQRRIVKYAGSELRTLDLGGSQNDSSSPDFELWSAEETQYQPLVPNDVDTMRASLQCGKQVYNHNSVYLGINDIVSSRIEIFIDLESPNWVHYKSGFLIQAFTQPYFNDNGKNRGSFGGYAVENFRVSPCWFPVQQPAGELWLLKKKLISYLNMGKDVRVFVDRTYVDVLEIIQEEGEIYSVLAPMTSSPGPEFYGYSTLGIRSFVSSVGELSSCRFVMESETIMEIDKATGVNVDWFVDSKTWTEVYSVFTNTTVAKGELSALRDAINSAKTVRLRLTWPQSYRVRFLSTQASSVADSGMVSTESKVTWWLTHDTEPTLTFNTACDQEMICVSSEGRIEVARFNVFTPTATRVLTEDILITWFIH